VDRKFKLKQESAAGKKKKLWHIQTATERVM
jgi:hypothetical protein